MTNKPQTNQQPENVELLSAQAPITSFRGLMIAIVATIISVVLYQILPYDENVNKGLTILAFVAIMWFTEAVHITVTALIVPLFAILFKVPEMGTKQALAGFSDPIIYVFFGGFALATALHMQKLDRKIAVWLISLSRGNTFIAVHLLFAVTAFLSMWISNTATAAMMLPLAMGLMSHLDKEKDRNQAAQKNKTVYQNPLIQSVAPPKKKENVLKHKEEYTPEAPIGIIETQYQKLTGPKVVGEKIDLSQFEKKKKKKKRSRGKDKEKDAQTTTVANAANDSEKRKRKRIRKDEPNAAAAGKGESAKKEKKAKEPARVRPRPQPKIIYPRASAPINAIKKAAISSIRKNRINQESIKNKTAAVTNEINNTTLRRKKLSTTTSSPQQSNKRPRVIQ